MLCAGQLRVIRRARLVYVAKVQYVLDKEAKVGEIGPVDGWVQCRHRKVGAGKGSQLWATRCFCCGVTELDGVQFSISQ
jgi:hypothetical protein